MRPSPRLLLVFALVASLLPGCALLQKFKRKKPAAAQEAGPRPAQLIGTIVLVNTEGAFVLIDNGSQPSPSIGSIAQSRAADGTEAKLKVTTVRKRPFVVADIVEGTPVKGDRVFQ